MGICSAGLFAAATAGRELGSVAPQLLNRTAAHMKRITFMEIQIVRRITYSRYPSLRR